MVKTLNQRPNGPVNAHLISGATVSTKTSFDKFDIVLEWVKVNSRSSLKMIYINFVEFEYIMLHAKFHDHRTISCEGEDF